MSLEAPKQVVANLIAERGFSSVHPFGGIPEENHLGTGNDSQAFKKDRKVIKIYGLQNPFRRNYSVQEIAKYKQVTDRVTDFISENQGIVKDVCGFPEDVTVKINPIDWIGLIPGIPYPVAVSEFIDGVPLQIWSPKSQGKQLEKLNNILNQIVGVRGIIISGGNVKVKILEAGKTEMIVTDLCADLKKLKIY